MFGRLKKLWKQTVAWFRPESGSAVTFKTYESPAPAIEVAKIVVAKETPATKLPPEVEAKVASIEQKLGLDPAPDMSMEDRVARAEEMTSVKRSNRAMRRKLERARRRHDKFVQPKGPVPTPVVAARKETPKPLKQKPVAELPPEPDEFDDPNDFLIADEWLEGDGQGDVLFEEQECFGEFNFRDTILDQLERYWVYLDRMRKHDKDAYEFYKVMGATLVPYMATGTRRLVPAVLEKFRTKEALEHYRSEIVLPPWFKRHWPSFGCIAYGINPIDEASELNKDSEGRLHAKPKFMYFRRLTSVPWMVQPVLGGHVYVLTIWWDRPQDRKHHERWGRPCEYPFHISDDGLRIRALKTRKHSDGNYGPWWDWQYPDQDWSDQYGLDVQTHLTHLFAIVAAEIETSNYSTVRVEVTKGDLTAVFGVSPSRTSYFFQDRDIILAANGYKRRIFHFVRPHIRKDGSAVRAHFRGLREFTWANYKVRITVPGLDHFMPIEFNAPMIWDATLAKERMLTEGETAVFLKEKMLEGMR